MKYEESTNCELKLIVNADFKKEIIAFANSDGGVIYVGVDKNGTPIGVSRCDEVIQQIGNMIRDGIRPDLTAYTTIEAIYESGVRLIVVRITRGNKRPYHLKEKGLKPESVFVRHGVSSVPATEEMIRQMLKESDGTVFDKGRSVNQELTFIYATDYFVKRGLAFAEPNRRTLGLLDADGYYTNAALLLSDQCEHSIKCAVYEGTGKTKFKTRKEFEGSLLKQLEEAYEFLSVNNNLNSEIDGLTRTDYPDYPPFALREALLNAVVHRDYDYSGSTLLNIYDDRIEFVSLGGLVKGITAEDIMQGISQSRNTVLANIFYRLELIESYGTGIQRMLEGYRNSALQPVFTPSPASFVTSLPKLKRGSTLSDPQKVLALFHNAPSVSRQDIEAALGTTKFPAIKLINSMLDAGLLKKEGAGRSVRYIRSDN